MFIPYIQTLRETNSILNLSKYLKKVHFTTYICVNKLLGDQQTVPTLIWPPCYEPSDLCLRCLFEAVCLNTWDKPDLALCTFSSPAQQATGIHTKINNGRYELIWTIHIYIASYTKYATKKKKKTTNVQKIQVHVNMYLISHSPERTWKKKRAHYEWYT